MHLWDKDRHTEVHLWDKRTGTQKCTHKGQQVHLWDKRTGTQKCTHKGQQVHLWDKDRHTEVHPQHIPLQAFSCPCLQANTHRRGQPYRQGRERILQAPRIQGATFSCSAHALPWLATQVGAPKHHGTAMARVERACPLYLQGSPEGGKAHKLDDK